MTTDRLQLQAAFDCAVADPAGGSVRHLVIELQAPRRESDRRRTPLNLGLVIDRSGSMRGDRLELASRAAAGVVVLKVTLPPGENGSTVAAGVEASWYLPGEVVREGAEAIDARLAYDRSPTGGWPVNERLAGIVAERWQSWVVRQAMVLNGRRKWDEAVAMVESELGDLERYAARLPEADRLIEELRRTARAVAAGMNERSRKEVYLAQYKGTSMRPDRRGTARPNCTDYLSRS